MNKNKTVWIIGSNSDIAKAFVKKYHSYFGTVVLASRDYPKVREFKSLLDGENILDFELDISDEISINRFVEAAPVPDEVIFFAGHIKYCGENEDTSAENIIRTYRTNVEGYSILIEKIYKIFAERKSGTIAALSSCAGDRGKSSNRIYSASKAALSVYLEGFMQAAEKDNIKTVIIKLGRANTKMLDNAASEIKKTFSCSCEHAADFIWRAVNKNKSHIYYYKKIWKPIMIIYKAIPLRLYNKIDF